MVRNDPDSMPGSGFQQVRHSWPAAGEADAKLWNKTGHLGCLPRNEMRTGLGSRPAET